MYLDKQSLTTTPPCCGIKGWIVTAAVSMLGLMLALGAVAGLIGGLIIMSCGGDECIDECRPCYTCLGQYTGQDTANICTVSSTSTNAQCTEQVYYLFRQGDSRNNIPCFPECRKCLECIRETREEEIDLNSTLWETVFPFFFQAPPPGVEPDSEEDDDDVSAENTTHAIGRRKRQTTYTSDGDACCQTERRPSLYLTRHIDTDGVSWHPVWFYKSWASPPYLYQLYDEIRCPLANPTCGSTSILCRVHAQTKSILMSRDPPHPETGYTYIMLHYPSSRVKFIDLQLPCYCRCTL